jgi:hypothetical protein
MRELVSLSDVMERLALGPNGGTTTTRTVPHRTAPHTHAPPHAAPVPGPAVGVLASAHGCARTTGLIYCMEYLEQNMDWLHEKLQQFKGTLLFFTAHARAHDAHTLN